MPAATAAIAKDLRRLAVPVGELKAHPSNPRRGDVDAIARSLDRFGQVRPILALPDGTIVAGHHVWYAAQQLGWDKVAAVREEMSDADARAYLVADNRLGDLATYDDEALAQVLSGLKADESLDGTGYTDKQVEQLLKRLEPPSGFSDPEPGEDDIDYRCPQCGYEWSGQAK